VVNLGLKNAGDAGMPDHRNEQFCLPHCMSPLLALNGHSSNTTECPLLGIKRTWRVRCEMSAYDPKRTFVAGAFY
jgi:hypothetical protein